MKKFNEQKELDQRNKRKAFIISLFVLIFVMFGLQVVISNLISTSGDKIQLMEQRYQSLMVQNEDLKKQIAQNTSLANLQKLAEEMGFKKNDSVVYLTPVVNVAMNY
jgi:cell division protein FtsL